MRCTLSNTVLDESELDFVAMHVDDSVKHRAVAWCGQLLAKVKGLLVRVFDVGSHDVGSLSK